jgi:Fe-S cluster biogenesis protein NfuA
MEKTELQNKVIAVLEQIRPYLQQDGGDLQFVELTDDNVVKVRLTGACGCCPHAVFTLKQGVEQAVKKTLPEIKSVESV